MRQRCLWRKKREKAEKRSWGRRRWSWAVVVGGRSPGKVKSRWMAAARLGRGRWEWEGRRIERLCFNAFPNPRRRNEGWEKNTKIFITFLSVKNRLKWSASQSKNRNSIHDTYFYHHFIFNRHYVVLFPLTDWISWSSNRLNALL